MSSAHFGSAEYVQWRAVAYDSSPAPDTSGDMETGVWHETRDAAEWELLERTTDDPAWEGYYLERRAIRYDDPERVDVDLALLQQEAAEALDGK